MEIDPNRKYQTRSGLLVTVYTTVAAGVYSVHGCTHESEDIPRSWTSLGMYSNEALYHPLDLIPLPNPSNLHPSTQAIIAFLKQSGIAEYHDRASTYEIVTSTHNVQMGTSIIEELISHIDTTCRHWRNLE